MTRRNAHLGSTDKVADKLLIGGSLTGSSGTDRLVVENPATCEVIADVPDGTAADVDHAVAAARACFDERRWRGISPAGRGLAMWRLADTIEAHSEELALLDVIDGGMPIWFTRSTVASAVAGLRYYAGMCTKIFGESYDLSTAERELLARTQMEPVGVVGGITPWNAPLAVLVTKIAPALAAGCSIILKPAEQTPLSALRVAELIVDADLPPGLINIVTGRGRTAGAALASHPDVDKLSFTGSTAVGKQLVQQCAGSLKRLTLELGGKSPIFIFADADMERTVPVCAMATFTNSGQICAAGTRVYVQRERLDEFGARIGDFARALRIGNGRDPQTQIGPLVSKSQQRRVLDYIDAGLLEGAELICGGGRHGDTGYFVEPTVFVVHEGIPRIATEEIFGPVLTVLPFDSLVDVEQIANDSDYGLAAAVFTSSLSLAERAVRRIRAGNIWINGYGVVDKGVAFGGFRQSGWGRENGMAGLMAYLEPKAVYTFL